MNEIIPLQELILTHERVDDIPLLFGLIQQLKVPGVLDRHLKNDKKHQGLSNGWLASVWIIYILSEGDHRKCNVQEWVERHQVTLERLLEQPIRAVVEFNDDRLERLLVRLSKKKRWEAIEAELWQSTIMVYDVEVKDVRLDSTTAYGYHTPTEEGVMQRGHSKDHRPDLPQLKLMAACAQPSGLVLGTEVHSGHRADDPLYLPLINRVRELLGRTGLLYAGDCKMAAIETRADIVAQGDYYLAPLPLIGETAAEMKEWIKAVTEGEQTVELFFDEGRPPEEQLLGAGYEFERHLSHEKVTHEEITNGLGQTMTVVKDVQVVKWTERVQVIRSQPLAMRQREGLAHRLNKAGQVLQGLTPPPGRGRRQYKEEAGLQAAIQQVLEKENVVGLLQVDYQRQEQSITRFVGRGRGGQNRPTREEVQVRYVITAVKRDESAIESKEHRLGWRVQTTNKPVEQMSLGETVMRYRLGSCLEGDFHMLKDQPLGISPLFVRLDDQITGITHLLTLALRILLLMQMQVRECLAKTQEVLPGLYEGQPTRTTNTPTAMRLLKAVAKSEITLTHLELGEASHWHLTPLPELIPKLLGFLKLSPSLYSRLTNHQERETGDPTPNSLTANPAVTYLRDTQNSS